jgi:hypothetical protein
MCLGLARLYHGGRAVLLRRTAETRIAAQHSGHVRAAYERHAALARAGASRDPLLAKNIEHVS